MTYPPRWPKWNAHPSLARPYPLVQQADGKYVLQRNNFLGLCWQHPGGWWTGQVLVFGGFHFFDWPDLEVAAYDLHRHWGDSSAAGVIAHIASGAGAWEPATWFNGHLPRSIKQATGRPSVAGSWRLSPSGNVLTLQLRQYNTTKRGSPWLVFWNGKRVVANKGFEWFATESAQQAAEDFDMGNRVAYRLR